MVDSGATPETDITATERWMKLSNPAASSTDMVVINNNLSMLAREIGSLKAMVATLQPKPARQDKRQAKTVPDEQEKAQSKGKGKGKAKVKGKAADKDKSKDKAKGKAKAKEKGKRALTDESESSDGPSRPRKRTRQSIFVSSDEEDSHSGEVGDEDGEEREERSDS
ncbi:MAG: hypothetical protein M1833_003036 [Piccolia ochrophora]|nr:MAG: hypothetical protein M1833_003036 [Piccolia ochrophora]